MSQRDELEADCVSSGAKFADEEVLVRRVGLTGLFGGADKDCDKVGSSTSSVLTTTGPLASPPLFLDDLLSSLSLVLAAATAFAFLGAGAGLALALALVPAAFEAPATLRLPVGPLVFRGITADTDCAWSFVVVVKMGVDMAGVVFLERCGRACVAFARTGCVGGTVSV